jgi:hypothetical protein
MTRLSKDTAQPGLVTTPSAAVGVQTKPKAKDVEPKPTASTIKPTGSTIKPTGSLSKNKTMPNWPGRVV